MGDTGDGPDQLDVITELGRVRVPLGPSDLEEKSNTTNQGN